MHPKSLKNVIFKWCFSFQIGAYPAGKCRRNSLKRERRWGNLRLQCKVSVLSLKSERRQRSYREQALQFPSSCWFHQVSCYYRSKWAQRHFERRYLFSARAVLIKISSLSRRRWPSARSYSRREAEVKRLSSFPVHCTTVTISHVLPAQLPVLMNQAPLIADFTLFGPIVSLHRRGFDSSGQAQGEGVDKKVSEALAARKHVNRIKY